jgi:hypothetical protein
MFWFYDSIVCLHFFKQTNKKMPIKQGCYQTPGAKQLQHNQFSKKPVFEVIWGQTNLPIDGPTNQHSELYRRYFAPKNTVLENLIFLCRSKSDLS